jgi:hypothetical protein
MPKRPSTIDRAALVWATVLSFLLALVLVGSVGDLFLARPALFLLGIPLWLVLGWYLYSRRNWAETSGPNDDDDPHSPR